MDEMFLSDQRQAYFKHQARQGEEDLRPSPNGLPPNDSLNH